MKFGDRNKYYWVHGENLLEPNRCNSQDKGGALFIKIKKKIFFLNEFVRT